MATRKRPTIAEQDAEVKAWAAERERLQRAVVDAARALLEHQQHAAFRLPIDRAPRRRCWRAG